MLNYESTSHPAFYEWCIMLTECVSWNLQPSNRPPPPLRKLWFILRPCSIERVQRLRDENSRRNHRTGEKTTPQEYKQLHIGSQLFASEVKGSNQLIADFPRSIRSKNSSQPRPIQHALKRNNNWLRTHKPYSDKYIYNRIRKKFIIIHGIILNK